MARLIDKPQFQLLKEEKDEPPITNSSRPRRASPGYLFDAQTGSSHNRCVFTLIPAPRGHRGVAFQLHEVATERIDMNKASTASTSA